MKKLLALLMVAILVVALGACGAKEDNVLTMGTNAAFPPYEFYENEKIVGIDADIAAIATKLGMELKIEDMEFGSLIGAVQTGKIDMCLAGMTVTDERKQSVNFSDSYATGVQVIIVKEDSPVKTFEDLVGGKKVGVQESTTGDIYASDTIENGGLGDEFVERYSKGTEAVQALMQGKIDAVIIDSEPAKSFVAANEGLKILDSEYVVEDYAIAIAKENTELLEKVNKALAELKADGTLDAIVARYISAE